MKTYNNKNSNRSINILEETVQDQLNSNLDEEHIFESIDIKRKKNFQTEFEELLKLKNDEFNYEKEIRELKEQKKIIIFKIKKNKREQNNIINSMVYFHKTEIKNISKEKRRNVLTGFQKKNSVPLILVKYLDLSKDIQLTRPELVKLMHMKWKTEGIKYGKDIILDENNGNLLGYPVGHKINFSKVQSFIASFFTL